jgi:hypothetical protein
MMATLSLPADDLAILFPFDLAIRLGGLSRIQSRSSDFLSSSERRPRSGQLVKQLVGRAMVSRPAEHRTVQNRACETWAYSTTAGALGKEHSQRRPLPQGDGTVAFMQPCELRRHAVTFVPAGGYAIAAASDNNCDGILSAAIVCDKLAYKMGREAGQRRT